MRKGLLIGTLIFFDRRTVTRGEDVTFRIRGSSAGEFHIVTIADDEFRSGSLSTAQRERTFRYDAENCLVLSLPSAFESEAFASAEEPLLGLFVNVDRLMVLELAEAMGIDQQAPAMLPQPSFEPVPLSGSLKAAAARLASALAFPEEASAIGAGLKQELVYRALKGPGANGLLALLRDNSANSKISKVLNLVHRDFETPFSTEGLAQVAGMSVSSFHRRFRDVTGDSPLHYIKKVRLHRGRVLIEQGQYRPSEVAGQVGYASISQFSREFSRHFDMPPSAAFNHARAH